MGRVHVLGLVLSLGMLVSSGEGSGSRIAYTLEHVPGKEEGALPSWIVSVEAEGLDRHFS